MGSGGLRPSKKTQILWAATDLLKEQGLQALSFEGLARQSGFSRQLVRYYYPDLESLVSDLCDHLAGTYRDALVAGIVEVGDVERLDFFLDFFFDLASKHRMPDNLKAYYAMFAYAVGSQRVRNRMCDQYKILGQVVSHELGLVHPHLDAQACEELSFLFVSLMHAHWSFVASLGYSREHSRLARSAMDRLITSYVSDSQPTATMQRPWDRDS